MGLGFRVSACTAAAAAPLPARQRSRSPPPAQHHLGTRPKTLAARPVPPPPPLPLDSSPKAKSAFLRGAARQARSLLGSGPPACKNPVHFPPFPCACGKAGPRLPSAHAYSLLAATAPPQRGAATSTCTAGSAQPAAPSLSTRDHNRACKLCLCSFAALRGAA